jgi:hypothetical protein
MRIVSAREQVQLLAAWRRTAGWADWKVTNEYPEHGGGARDEEARLENGHTLGIGSGNWNSNGPPWRWHWHISDANDEYVTGSGEDNPPAHSPEEARQTAEQAYEKIFPAGKANTGPHDSGVDYSDLNKFMEGS